MIKVEIKGLDSVSASINGVQKQMPFVIAQALTRIAYLIRQAIIDEMAHVLDRPTFYTLKQAIQVIPATKSKQEATIGLGVKVSAPAKGTPYVKALGHLFTGGSRTWKRMEGAFRGSGILPAGYMMVPAANSWAMKLDSFGNAPKGQIVQLLSYFNSFGEQGFKANMTDKRRKTLAKAGKTASGYKTINGVAYFVSRGKTDRNPLSAGIWAKRGTHGSDVAPVFIFVKRGQWRQLINIERIAQTIIDKHWKAEFDRSFSDAMRSAR